MAVQMVSNKPLTKAPKSKSSRLRARLTYALIAVPVAVLGLWIAVNRVEWLGPIVADSMRAVIGKDNVAKLEDFAYALQDKVFVMWRSGEKPKAYWQVPSEPVLPAEEPPTSPVQSESPGEPKLPPFKPTPVGPVLASWSAPGDGTWLAMPDVDHPAREIRMYKTLLHPDKQRSWAELFVVAIDLRRTLLQLVPGSKEPAATEAAALDMVRPGRVPEAYEADVLAAFNGGFKTEHGRYGMKVGDLVVVKPRDGVCTIAHYKDGSIRIASWEKLKDSEAQMAWWRQTPECMYEDNALNPKLKDTSVRKWGATLDGETVIRRSAIGISQDGKTLYVGISNHTNAPAIALGMNHAGAVTVAQLDINYSYPKFITFEKNEEQGKRIAIALAEGFEFSEDEFIRKPSRRDFFYVLATNGDGRTASNSAADAAPGASAVP